MHDGIKETGGKCIFVRSGHLTSGLMICLLLFSSKNVALLCGKLGVGRG